MRYYVTPIRMAAVKKKKNQEVEKRPLVHRWWECQPVQPLRKAVWRVLDV